MIKRIENCVFYFYNSVPLFEFTDYPYKIINVFIADKYFSGEKLRDRNEKHGEAPGQVMCDSQSAGLCRICNG
jgi:hypothetical protein